MGCSQKLDGENPYFLEILSAKCFFGGVGVGLENTEGLTIATRLSNKVVLTSLQVISWFFSSSQN